MTFEPKNYLDLITSAWREKPKFTATVTTEVSVQIDVQNLMLAMMTTLFDLDSAVGDQLDILGEWVGLNRFVNVPATGIYFSWDTIDLGWDQGIWYPTVGDPGTITVLPDDVYRIFIKAKIAANQWDGTTTGMYEIWDTLFPNFGILVQDNQDMTYNLAFVGANLDNLTLALLTNGYLTLKPEGVRVAYFYVPANPGPLFAWDMETTLVDGWEEGSWVTEVPAIPNPGI